MERRAAHWESAVLVGFFENLWVLYCFRVIIMRLFLDIIGICLIEIIYVSGFLIIWA